jgi:hypothetical protein
MTLPPNPTDEQIDEYNKKQLFVRDALPASWLEYAEELEAAAEALWADSGNGMVLQAETQLDGSLLTSKVTAHSRSYILLASLALENILKGLIIANDPSLITSGSLAKSITSHKLIELAKKINGLVLSSEERNILQICQDAIPYWGRYPIPLEYQGLKPAEAASDKFRSCFRQLHFRLCKQLYDLIKDGLDSGVGAGTLNMRSIRYGDTIDPKEKFPWAKDNDK